MEVGQYRLPMDMHVESQPQRSRNVPSFQLQLLLSPPC